MGNPETIVSFNYQSGAPLIAEGNPFPPRPHHSFQAKSDCIISTVQPSPWSKKKVLAEDAALFLPPDEGLTHTWDLPLTWSGLHTTQKRENLE